MKLTLLDMVQSILSVLDSDEVNSIGDTIESLQVANIVRDTYFEIINNQQWSHTYELIKLDASNDVNRPTHMQMPDNIKELEWISYNKIKFGESRNRFEQISYKSPSEFIHLTNQYDNTQDTIQVVTDFSGVQLQIRNDKAPEYWTSFDDEWIVFNSFDSEIDTTLQQSKTQCYAQLTPTWSHTDSFIPDLPDEAFPHFLAECKSVCFLQIKQVADSKSEQQSRRQRRWLAHKGWSAHERGSYPDYGRRGKK